MMKRRKLLIAGAFAALAAAAPVLAQNSDVLLTIRGVGDVRHLTRADLEAMETVSFETSTIWTDGVQSFTGVPLSAIAASLGVRNGTLLASAVNDYTIEFPVVDAMQDGPVIAFLRNGAPMSVRNKGPLWLVYPFDSDPAFQTELAYSRSIWQMDRLAWQP